ncbi:MAG TPA: cardiolipin synthase [Williamwhitmania sp.]|nr:cardiolipin synthase [Williamwhitmania sp.]
MDGINHIFDFLLQVNFSKVLLAIYIITVLATAAIVVHEKRDPVRTASWVLVLFLLPIAGIILYIYFGQNFRKEKIFSRKGMHDIEQIGLISDAQLIRLNRNDFPDNPNITRYIKIIKLLLNNSKALLSEKNSVLVMNSGKETFSNLLQDLAIATSSIHLEYYILSDDVIGNQIKDILVEKARSGVEVRVIFDDVGSWSLPKSYIRHLHDNEVEAFPFMEVKFPWFTSKVNYRNHRKIVVIDGKVGYVGGINVADRYIHGDPKLGYWRDTHLKVEGDAVRSLQAIFLIDWYFVSKQQFTDRQKYFPATTTLDKHLVQITACGPDSDWASIMQAYFLAIATAKEHIYISTPYFMPNESILTALKTASLSGVDIKILLPGKSDSKMVYWGTLSYLSELLEAGINVYLFEAGFNHSKIIMIDGCFSSVGTANMDMRSFEDNFEVNAIIYDPEVTLELEKRFLLDIKLSKKILLEEWEDRPLRKSFLESFARLFTPLL